MEITTLLVFSFNPSRWCLVQYHVRERKKLRGCPSVWKSEYELNIESIQRSELVIGRGNLDWYNLLSSDKNMCKLVACCSVLITWTETVL